MCFCYGILCCVSGGRRALREHMAVSIFTYRVSIFLILWRISSPRIFVKLWDAKHLSAGRVRWFAECDHTTQMKQQHFWLISRRSPVLFPDSAHVTVIRQIWWHKICVSYNGEDLYCDLMDYDNVWSGDYSEDGGIMFLWNPREQLPDKTKSYHKDHNSYPSPAKNTLPSSDSHLLIQSV